jgi:hypothetical protein
VAFNILAASLPPNEKPSGWEEKLFDFTLESPFPQPSKIFLKFQEFFA